MVDYSSNYIERKEVDGGVAYILDDKIDFEQVFHVLLPKGSRFIIGYRMPTKSSYIKMHNAFLKEIKKLHTTSYIDIMRISPMSEPDLKDIDDDDDDLDPEFSNFHVVYMAVPHEIIEKIFDLGIKKIIFYNGLSENSKEFKVLNGRPLDESLSFTNKDGTPLPYESKQICLS